MDGFLFNECNMKIQKITKNIILKGIKYRISETEVKKKESKTKTKELLNTISLNLLIIFKIIITI